MLAVDRYVMHKAPSHTILPTVRRWSTICPVSGEAVLHRPKIRRSDNRFTSLNAVQYATAPVEKLLTQLTLRQFIAADPPDRFSRQSGRFYVTRRDSLRTLGEELVQHCGYIAGHVIGHMQSCGSTDITSR